MHCVKPSKREPVSAFLGPYQRPLAEIKLHDAYIVKTND